MDNLDSISQAIQSILTSSGGDEESFTNLVERYLRSNDPSIRRAIVEVLLEVIAESGSDQDRRRRFILEDTSLTYVPLLLPSTVDAYEGTVNLLQRIAEVGRPREVCLAFNEALQALDETANGAEMSDDGLVIGGEMGDTDELHVQLSVILKCYAIAIERLPNTKSTPTLLALTDSLSSTLTRLAAGTDYPAARSILTASCDLVDSAWRWVQGTTDKGGEQRAILAQLLFMAVTLLGPRLEAGLLERWFLKINPKFTGLHGEDNTSSDGDGGRKALQRAAVSAAALHITADELFDRLIHPSPTSPHSALAALHLLASSLPSIQAVPLFTITNALSETLLSDCLPVLSAALSSSAPDAGTVWLWCLIHSISSNGEKVASENASLLLELLVPLAGMAPTPTAALALQKLIGAIIQSVASPKDQIILFQQLLESANPFEQIRVQAISLLREAIVQASLLPPSESTILTPFLLQTLTPILFNPEPSSSHPLAPQTPPLSLPLEPFLGSMWPPFLSDALTFLRLLITLDHGNATGVRDGPWAGEITTRWIGPQMKRCRELNGEALARGLDAGALFVLDRWEDVLRRTADAVDQLCRGEIDAVIAER